MPGSRYIKSFSTFLFAGLCLLACANSVSAQKVSKPISFAGELLDAEDSLKYYLDSVRASTDDVRKQYWNNKFRKKMARTAELPGAFDYPFDKLTTIGKLSSPDKFFRMFNWNIENADLTHSFYAYVLIPSRKKNKVVELLDRSNGIDRPEPQALDQQRWYGCLYYKIIPMGGNKNEYTLLAVDMNNRSLKRRIIEVMNISKTKISFGNAIFDYNDKTLRKRVVFEHSALCQMALRYDEENTRIVFDHLVPESPQTEGMYEYYYPDGTYDALILDNGQWRYAKDLDDIKNPKNGLDKLYNAPKGADLGKKQHDRKGTRDRKLKSPYKKKEDQK
ncbi:MAG TPA: hypothetical protein VK177_19865 [Flavobacteriales bacterium]|nr:hypothetical protein [Flavobacteriales bacterium]